MSKNKIPLREQPRGTDGQYGSLPAQLPTSAPVLMRSVSVNPSDKDSKENNLSEIFARFQVAHGRVPVLGLDLDGTSADMVSGLRPIVAKSKGMTQEEAHTKLPNPSEYEFSKGKVPWFADRVEFLTHFQAAEKNGFYRELPAYAGAVDVLKALAEQGFEIKAVTARGADYNADTAYWLRSQGVPVTEIIHSGFDKHLVEGIDIFIDDNPHVIKGLVDTARKVVIFDQEYNAHHNIDSTEHTRRVLGWNLDTMSEALGDLL